MNRRRLFIIIGVIAAVALVAIGAYLRLRQAPGAPPDGTTPGTLPAGGTLPDGETATSTGSLPPVAVMPAAKGIVVDYFVRPDGTTAFIKPDGEIIVASTTASIANPVKIANLLDAQFSNTGNYVLVKYGAAARPDWSVYDLQKNAWKQLGIETREADWAPNTDTIAYIAERASSVALATLDVRPAVLRPRIIATLSAQDLIVKWAGASRIIVFTRPSATVPGAVFAYDLKTNRMALLYENIKGIDIRWSSADRGLLLRTQSGRGSAGLFMIDGDGRKVSSLSFLTLPGKCTWDGADRLLCGIPKDVAGFRQKDLPDAYTKREFGTADALYAIDLNSGATEEVANEIGGAYDMTRVKLFGNAVHFVNRWDGFLYKIDLPAKAEPAN